MTSGWPRCGAWTTGLCSHEGLKIGNLNRLPANFQGVLWMLFGGIFFTLVAGVVRHLSYKYSAFEIVFYRVLIGSVIQLPWLFRAGVGVLRTSRMGLFWMRSAFAYAGMVCYFFAVGNMKLADVTAVQFTLPLFITLLAVVVLGERIGIHRIVALLVGFCGVLVMLRPGAMDITLAVSLALISPVFYAGSHISIKLLSRTESSDLIVFHGFLLTVPIAVIPMFFVASAPVWADLPGLLGIGVFSTLAHVGLVRAFAHGEASVVAPFDFLRLPFVALLGLVYFAEWPDLWTWVGALVIFVSATHIARREARVAQQNRGG